MKGCICFCLVLALLLLSGCTTGGEQGKGTYLTFTDDSGRDVVLDTCPVRVAVLLSSLADMWLEAGGEVAVTVGEAVERGLVADDVLLVDGGAGKTVNTELLLSLAPDLVIGSLDVKAHVDCAALLREVGTTVALFHVENFDDYARVMGHMTAITGDTEAYVRYVDDQQMRIEALLSQEREGEAPSVLFLRAGSSARSTKAKTAEQHFAAAMVVELGGVNLADEAPVLIDTLSLEAVMKADPDLVLISTMGDAAAARAHIEAMLSEPGWQMLTAVKEGRVHILPKELFQFKPCGAWYEAYGMLAELMYETKP